MSYESSSPPNRTLVNSTGKITPKLTKSYSSVFKTKGSFPVSPRSFGHKTSSSSNLSLEEPPSPRKLGKQSFSLRDMKTSPNISRKESSSLLRHKSEDIVENPCLKRSNSLNDIVSLKDHHEEIARRYTIAGERASNEFIVEFMDDELLQQDESKEEPYDSVPLKFGDADITDPFSLNDDEVFDILNQENDDYLNDIEMDGSNDIKSGTMKALIRKITSDIIEQDSIDSFLLTYDLFIDHYTFLCIFILFYRAQRYIDDDNIDNSNPVGDQLTHKSRKDFIIQFRIVKLLTQWITLRYESIRYNKSLINLYNKFVSYVSEDKKMVKIADQLSKIWKDMKHKRNNLKRNLQISKPIRINSLEKTLYTNPTSIPPLVLAQQLTVMDQNVFGRIHIDEYRNLNFNKNSSKLAPNLKYMVKQFNKVSFWVATLIVSRTSCYSSGQRGQLISYFIKVMECLKNMNSFNSLLQIFSALNMASVSRLSKAWNYVPPKLMTILSDVTKMFEMNYKEYRSILEVTDPPCIPIQEVILRDLTFIEENPNLLENNWINFEKMKLLGKTLKLVKRFQSKQYELKSNNHIYEWIVSYKTMDSDELFNESLMIEPSEELKLKAKEEKKKEKREKRVNEYKRIQTKKRNAELRKSGSFKKEWIPTVYDVNDHGKVKKKEIIDRIIFDQSILYKIIDHRKVSSSVGNEKSKPIVEYLCIWNRKAYIESTWETAGNIKDTKKLEDYITRSHNNLKSNKFLSKSKRPSFNDKIKIKSNLIKSAELKEHHISSVKWLYYSWCKSLNCILADESGLGKMIQIITFLGLLQFKLNVTGPFLIVTPFSRLIKWDYEFARNLPDMNVFVYEGDPKSREFFREHMIYNKSSKKSNSYKFNTIITSFEALSKDYEYFSSIKWNAFIVDHIEKRKTLESSPYEPFNRFICPSKIIITNQPNYSTCKTLWQLLNFFDPDTYNNFETFELEVGSSIDIIFNNIKSRTLRRLKKDIDCSNQEYDILSSNYIEFCKHVDDEWRSLDFNDKSDLNIRKITEVASIIFAKFLSRTSKNSVPFNEKAVFELKNALKLPKQIPSTLFDELYSEAKIHIVSRTLKK